MELIRTKRVNLRIVDGEADHRFLFQTLTHPDCAFAFKWRGTTELPAEREAGTPA